MIAGLSALAHVLAGTSTHGCWSLWTASGLAVSLASLGVFLTLERRAEKSLFPLTSGSWTHSCRELP